MWGNTHCRVTLPSTLCLCSLRVTSGRLGSRRYHMGRAEGANTGAMKPWLGDFIRVPISQTLSSNLKAHRLLLWEAKSWSFQEPSLETGTFWGSAPECQGFRLTTSTSDRPKIKAELLINGMRFFFFSSRTTMLSVIDERTTERCWCSAFSIYLPNRNLRSNNTDHLRC